MAGKSEPETASDSPVRWTRMHHPPPISHPATLKKDTVYVRVSMSVCVCVCVCVLSLRQLPNHLTHTHTLIHTQSRVSEIVISFLLYFVCVIENVHFSFSRFLILQNLPVFFLLLVAILPNAFPFPGRWE